jgi:hypothetical protein
MMQLTTVYKSLISEYNEDYKDPYADAEQEYKVNTRDKRLVTILYFLHLHSSVG